MQHQTAQPRNRDSIHDLRNLFGVVASARHMLEDAPTPERRTSLLEAIEDAAARGAKLTTDLLAHQSRGQASRQIDIGDRLHGLKPLLSAFAAHRIEIRLEIPAIRLPVRLDPADFDAVVLELVANAAAAIGSSGRIQVRARRCAGRIWLLVADTGQGMGRPELDRALLGAALPSARGSGLGRILQFARAQHGRLRIRSRKGCGTVVILNLPLVLGTAGARTFPARQNSYHPKET
ncbi:sensor histidine kinase [Sphingomonas oryzagri]